MAAEVAPDSFVPMGGRADEDLVPSYAVRTLNTFLHKQSWLTQHELYSSCGTLTPIDIVHSRPKIAR